VARPAPTAVVTQITAAPAAASCGKGLFWPFVRDNGDCPTEVERTSGAKTPVSVPASAPAQATTVATPAVVTQVSAAPAAPAAASCGKSWLWPFVRDAGDCATAADKANVSTSAAPASSAPAVVPASATMAAPAAAPQPAAAPAETGCHKGLFWPFVREPGDCPSSADQGQSRSGRS
jgi:hypothetical protein